jgi:hypothetical protein
VMTLNLLKLCVGCDSIEDLIAWREEVAMECKRRGIKPEMSHVTRMMPKRGEEILDGGSLYWVIKGNVQARQAIIDIRSVQGSDGIGRCQLVLNPVVIPTQWQPRRPFQGWRYLTKVDAPIDLGAGQAGILEMPRELREELASLGLL